MKNVKAALIVITGLQASVQPCVRWTVAKSTYTGVTARERLERVCDETPRGTRPPYRTINESTVATAV